MSRKPDLPAPVRVHACGAQVATYVLTADDRPPRGDVVLCHGTPWSAVVWAPLAQLVAQHYRVFCWDMPGYGASITPEKRSVGLVPQRRRFAALLDHWGLNRPHVVAHDIGGAVALGALLLEGCEFSSLYLLDVVALDPWGSPFFRLVGQHEDVFAQLPPNLHEALVREYIASAAEPRIDAEWIDTLVQPWLSVEGRQAFYRQIAQLSPDDTRPVVQRLDRVGCPVRIGWGECDPWIPATQASELAARLAGRVEIRTFPSSGHLVPLESTAELARDVLTWLECTPSDPGRRSRQPRSDHRP